MLYNNVKRDRNFTPIYACTTKSCVFFNNYTGGVFDIKMFRASYAFAIIATQLHAIQKYARSNQ